MHINFLQAHDHHVLRLDDLAAIEAALTAEAQPFWLDIESPSQAEVDWLARVFKFHPLALEDVLTKQLRPKFDAYEDFLFLVSHSIRVDEEGTDAEEIESFLGKNYLVTTHSGPSALIEHVRRNVEGTAVALGRGPDHVLYLILAAVAETYFVAIDLMDERIDDLETRVVSSPHPRALDSIFGLRRTLATMRRYGSPLRDAINSLLAHEGGFIRRSNALYLRDVHNLLITIHEMVDNQRDLTSGVLDAYLSTTSNRLNDVVKRLTIVANIFLPISFVVGFFGMNFTTLIPFEDATLFRVLLAVLVLVPVGMLVWFRRLGWL